MRVIYEISLEDMRSILAEKYEVDRSKIEFMGHGDLTFARIDMSETETPGELKFEYAPISPEFLKKVLEEREKWLERNKTTEQKKSEPTDEDVQESSYKFITDEVLEAKIKAGKTIPEICADFSLTDSKYFARLYKRAEKFRSEDARRSNKKKAEDSEPGTE